MKRFPWVPLLALALGALVPAQPASARTASPDTVIAPCDGRVVPVGWQLQPARPCQGDSVRVVFRSCRDCVDLIGFTWPSGGPLTVHTRSPLICAATLLCTPDSLVVPLGRFAAGHFKVIYVVASDIVVRDSVVCTIVRHDSLQFDVATCAPPPPGILPFVTQVRIGPPGVCVGCPPRICPGDSIPIFVTGMFPDNCHRLRRIEVLPYLPTVDPPTSAPPFFVRLIVDDMACLGRPCILGEFPFEAATLMPPLRGGAYVLGLQEAQVTCSDSVKAGDSIFVARVPFAVVERCSSEVFGCLLPVFGPPPKGGCNTVVSPDHPGVLELGVNTTVPLAGLQGEFRLSPSGLRIRNLEPIGAAVGMRFDWTPTTEGGARFVLFADRGAPIGGEATDSAGSVYRLPAQVLRITVVQPPGVRVAASTNLTVSLLGSDITGATVPECPSLDATRFGPIGARICAGATCDFNGDGVTDVRDLVRMVHCVLHTGPCPDSTVGFDCNGDGATTLDDVLCCARVILRGGGGGHDSIPGRSEPGVEVSFGEPVRTSDGLDVTLHLAGADRIGAARLTLSYPRDRFDIASVELLGETTSWLSLHEVTEDALVLGLIGMASGGAQSVARDVDLTLHLALKPGQQAGGELRVGSSDFSGPDGAALQVDLGAPALTITGRATLVLTAARPNPFSGETRFTLSLTRAAVADVAVLDLSGRRVAVLHHGRLEAGGHSFAWQGTRADGSRAPEGVYFLRARAAGETTSRRVVLLRGN